MPSFASGVTQAGEGNGTVSPRLAIAMVGCILAFLAITIGFLLVARKTHRTPSSPSSSQPVPRANSLHDRPNHITPARRGITLPVASPTKCPTCSKPSGKCFEASRASFNSLHSQAEVPLPRYTRYAPTGAWAIRPEIWSSASSSGAASPTTSTNPPSPPPAYMGRGSTASFRRAVY